MEPSPDAVEDWLRSPRPEALHNFSDADRRMALVRLVDTSPLRAIVLLRALAPEQRSGAIDGLPEDRLRRILVDLVSPEERRPKKWTDFCPWSGLRPLGNFALFKVSYVALLLLPWVSRIAEYLQAGGYTYIGALYFGDLFLALGNLVYDIRCPSVIKRWESPNDFYIQMLEVAARQQQCYPDDKWIGNLEHSKTAYLRQAYSLPATRVFCVVLYFVGLTLLAYVLVERSWHVLHPILSGGTRSG